MNESQEQHVPGQQEVPAWTAERAAQLRQEQAQKVIPSEGNNIANVQDRAHADTPPANEQPVVDKTFVSPPDATSAPKQ